MTAAARERLRVRLPVMVASAGAWAVLASAPGTSSPHVHDRAVTFAWPWASGWAVMLVAMMLPLTMAALRHVRDRSFARRRPRAAALFLVGYSAPWMAAGAILVPSALATRETGTSFWAVLAVALAWHCSPARQHCFNRGHAHPVLAPAGARADLDVMRFGAGHGLWCVGSCGAVMVAALMFPGAHLAAMALAAVWLLAERMDGPDRPRWRVPFPSRPARALAAWPARLVRRPGRRDVSSLNISSL